MDKDTKHIWYVEYYYYDTVYNNGKAYLVKQDAIDEVERLNKENTSDAYWEVQELEIYYKKDNK